MWKHVLNVRNILMLIALVALVAVIVSQQSLLKREAEAYRDAKAKADQVEQSLSDVRSDREAAQNGGSEEDIARADGYVEDDEIVFIYD